MSTVLRIDHFSGIPLALINELWFLDLSVPFFQQNKTADSSPHPSLKTSLEGDIGACLFNPRD